MRGLIGELLGELRKLDRSEASKLRTVAQMAEECPAFPESRLRHLVDRAATNGLLDSGAIVRKGGRVLIHRERFDSWVTS